jgi:hypothetical protein
MDTKRTNRSDSPRGDRNDGRIEDTDVSDVSEELSSRPPNAGPDYDENIEISDQLQRWLDDVNSEKLPTTCNLYKFDHPVTGHAKVQIWQYAHEIPDAHTIGMQFGSGRYMLIVKVPASHTQKAFVQSRTFRIAPYYDTMRRQAVTSANTLPAGSPPQQMIVRENPMQGMEAFMAMFSQFITMIAPLINRPAMSPAGEMAAMYGGINKVMQQQALETASLLSDMQRKISNVPIPPNEEDEGEGMDTPKTPTLLEQIAPYIAKFLPAILGKGPVAATTVQTVKSLPQFKHVVNDPVQVKQLIEHLDKTQGKLKTDKVLAKFKITRPK